MKPGADGELEGRIESFDVDIAALGIPPKDLQQTLPQQLLILKATMEAIAEVKKFPNKQAGVFVGMGCDCEVTRSGMCWRLPQFVCDWLQTSEITQEMKLRICRLEQFHPMVKLLS